MTGGFGRSGGLLLLAAALLMGGAVEGAERKKKSDARLVDWTHPWLGDKRFDYAHRKWHQTPKSEWAQYFERNDTTFARLADGSEEYRWSAVLKVNDPSKLPAIFYINRMSAARGAELVEWEASYTSAAGVEELDRSRLLLGTARDEGDGYVSMDQWLALMVPNSRPGTLRIDLVIREKPFEGFEGYFAGYARVQPGPRCVSRTLTVEVPESQAGGLRFEQRHFATTPATEVADGVSRTTFRFETLHALWTNPGRPHSLDTFPTLFWSNQPDWITLGKLFSGVWEPHLVASPSLAAWAADVTAGSATVAEKARAVHDAVADGWSYLGFYPAESGWEPHDASACFDARFGDCKDQTALMIAALRSVGVSASPALVWSGRPYAWSEVPTVVANHAIVWAADPDHPAGGFLMDSVDTSTGALPLRQSLAGRTVLVLDPTGSFRHEEPPSRQEDRLHEDEAVVVVTADGVRVDLSERWHGETANARRSAWRSADPAVWAADLEARLLSRYPEASIEALAEGPDPDDPDSWLLTATLRADGLLRRAGDYVVVELPWLQRWAAHPKPSDGRIHPRELTGTWRVSRIVLKLPVGTEVLLDPGDASEEREDFVSSLRTTRGEDELTIVLDVQRRRGRMDRKQEFVRTNFFVAVAGLQRRPVVLRLPGSR